MSEDLDLFEGVNILKLKTHHDYRGFFREVLRLPFNQNQQPITIAQISHSEVYPGVIKAWHAHAYQYQWTYVVKGNLLVALVDKRNDSSSFNKVYSFICGDNDSPMIYGFPPGVYHGYRNIGESCQVIYMTSGQYDLEDELRLDPNTKEINFNWNLKYK
ncbi:dTDP-4-dehydrorhamnose 3,5-epimerase family protein [Prochlorococcus sp. MIT 1307]|uniref:dTDP-4-dehydrorhamnose 3,5-epimerase family protein n=1 Tax=Prochlorococcus sp. MIT 1307 TaxID=3096219 RepID=UPI002A75C888|nr:dTDP-4-dehydrorhamnose 3,5-epimerase family protein [Prochlorococcus sp. MIT 1307]